MISYFHATWLIAKRDWLEAASTKLFWVGVLLGPILVIILIAISMLATTVSIFESIPFEEEERSNRYAVIDHTNLLGQEIADAILLSDLRYTIQYVRDGDHENYDFEILNELAELVKDHDVDELVDMIGDTLLESTRTGLVSLDDSAPFVDRFSFWWEGMAPFFREHVSGFSQYWEVDQHKVASELDELVSTRQIDGYFVISSDFVNGEESGTFFTLADSDHAFGLQNWDHSWRLQNWYTRFASEVVRKHRFAASEIDFETVNRLMRPSHFERITPNEQISDSVASLPTSPTDTIEQIDESMREEIAQFAPIGYQYILWFMVLIGSAMILAGTVEEKSTRIAELILSSSTASQLMDGKLIGVALVLLTIASVWMCMLGVLMFFGGSLISMLPNVNVGSVVGLFLNPIYIVNFLIYFILGFAFYGYLQSAVGSVCGNIREAQTLAVPIQMVLVIPIFFMVAIVMNPDSVIVTVFSFFPPFTPFLMISLSASLPALPIYLLILVVMIGATLGVRFLAARIYRQGILLENKPQKFIDFVKLAAR